MLFLVAPNKYSTLGECGPFGWVRGVEILAAQEYWNVYLFDQFAFQVNLSIITSLMQKLESERGETTEQ